MFLFVSVPTLNKVFLLLLLLLLLLIHAGIKIDPC